MKEEQMEGEDEGKRGEKEENIEEKGTVWRNGERERMEQREREYF